MDFVQPTESQLYALAAMAIARSSPCGWAVEFPPDWLQRSIVSINAWLLANPLQTLEQKGVQAFVDPSAVAKEVERARECGIYWLPVGMKESCVLGQRIGEVQAFRVPKRMRVDATWARPASEDRIRRTAGPKLNGDSSTFDAVLVLIWSMELRRLHFDQPIKPSRADRHAPQTDEQKAVEAAHAHVRKSIDAWMSMQFRHHASSEAKVHQLIDGLRDNVRRRCIALWTIESSKGVLIGARVFNRIEDVAKLAFDGTPQVVLRSASINVCLACNGVQYQFDGHAVGRSKERAARTIELLELGTDTSFPTSKDSLTFTQALDAWFAPGDVGEGLCERCADGVCAPLNVVLGKLPPRLAVSWTKGIARIGGREHIRDWKDVPIKHWRIRGQGYEAHHHVESYRVAGVIFTNGSHFWVAWRELDDQWIAHNGASARGMQRGRLEDLGAEGTLGYKAAAPIVVLENVLLFPQGGTPSNLAP